MKFLPMLKQFREERGLNGYNCDAFIMMVSQELGEVLDADNWNHRVEEMCDVCVLCFNALAQGACEYPSADYKVKPLERISHAVGMSKLRLKSSSPILCDVISFMRWCIVLNGYDFELSMIETCKKILSREGTMNEETGKWEKSRTQDKSTLYVPNYDNCKL